MSSSIFDRIQPSTSEILKQKGITAPTDVQALAFEPVFAGQDVIAQSRTGSGKTLAFGLPAIERLLSSGLLQPQNKAVQMMVLTPTRELAEQVAKVFEETFSHLGIKILAVTGGKSYRFQISSLHRGVTVVVGTPGRVIDLIDQRALDLTKLQVLVLDEMDEMLDFGFMDDILKVREAIGVKVQTLLFSATFPDRVRNIASKMVLNPHTLKVVPKDDIKPQIEHEFAYIQSGRSLDALLALLLYHNPDHALIFCKTREETRVLHTALIERGFQAGLLNGEMTQEDRSFTMQKFRDRSLKLLVATDVAARGIDVSGLSHVINFNVPNNTEAYTHRAGRTGRADAFGKAWTIVTPREARDYEDICFRTKIKSKRLKIPLFNEVTEKVITHILNNQEIFDGGSEQGQKIEKLLEAFIENLPPEEQTKFLLKMLKTQAARVFGKRLNLDNIQRAGFLRFEGNQEQRPPRTNAPYSGRPNGGGGYQGNGGNRRREGGREWQPRAPQGDARGPQSDARGGDFKKRAQGGAGGGYPIWDRV